MHLDRNIHKYNWTSPDGKNHTQIDHVLIDGRWHSSILDIHIFRGDDCGADHYFVVANFKETLAVNKQATQTFDGGMNLRKLNELEAWEQYQTEISNMRAALENLSDGEDINRAWKNIKGNIKTSATERLGLHELKQHKHWLDENVEVLCTGSKPKQHR